jgi:diadenosine tetraphosphate (Ap4A) HIT family hydrolase
MGGRLPRPVPGAARLCLRRLEGGLSLGNGVPHLHVHLVPRPLDDARAGSPVESEAFNLATTPALSTPRLQAEAAALRADLGG